MLVLTTCSHVEIFVNVVVFYNNHYYYAEDNHYYRLLVNLYEQNSPLRFLLPNLTEMHYSHLQQLICQ